MKLLEKRARERGTLDDEVKLTSFGFVVPEAAICQDFHNPTVRIRCPNSSTSKVRLLQKRSLDVSASTPTVSALSNSWTR